SFVLEFKSNLSMKTILITGASSGFGRLLTELLSAESKYNIVASMRNTNGSNSTVKSNLEKLPGVEVVELDVTDEQQVNETVAKALQKYESVDILINNAG